MKIICFICLFIAVALLSSCADRYVVERFDVSQGREIVFYGDTYVDVAQCIRYEINVKGKIIVPQSCMCMVTAGDWRSLNFKLLSAKNGNLIGISSENNTNMVFAIHGFNENLTWPGEVEGKKIADEKGNAEKLFKELQKEYPQIKREVVKGVGSCHAEYLPPND